MKRTKENLALKKNEQSEVADIFRRYGEDFDKYNSLSYEQKKVMHHIEVCRTAELGGHVRNTHQLRSAVCQELCQARREARCALCVDSRQLVQVFGM